MWIILYIIYETHIPFQMILIYKHIMSYWSFTLCMSNTMSIKSTFLLIFQMNIVIVYICVFVATICAFVWCLCLACSGCIRDRIKILVFCHEYGIHFYIIILFDEVCAVSVVLADLVMIPHVDMLIVMVTVFINGFCKAYPTEMRNTGLIVMISSKTENQKAEERDVSAVIMAWGQQAAMVRLQSLMSHEQLASVQAGHAKAHWSRRLLVVRPQALPLTHGKHCTLYKGIWWADDFSSGSVACKHRMYYWIPFGEMNDHNDILIILALMFIPKCFKPKAIKSKKHSMSSLFRMDQHYFRCVLMPKLCFVACFCPCFKSIILLAF